jgi:GxxExxY protein
LCDATGRIARQILRTPPTALPKCQENTQASGMQVDDGVPSEGELNRIAAEIIGAGIAVHRAIDPGCYESAYSPCLAYELQKRRLDFTTKVAVAIQYEGLSIPRAFEADFIVEDSVVLELKSITALSPADRRQLQTYLRFTGCPLGLLLNFGAATMREGTRRVVNNFPEGTRRDLRGEAAMGETKGPDQNRA